MLFAFSALGHCCDFVYLFAKKIETFLAISTQNTAMSAQKIIISNNQSIFCQQVVKFAKNSDHGKRNRLS
jgi:hypothetical protein